jgi:[ribosomal protein S18]-alanine N-acetyltransferase
MLTLRYMRVEDVPIVAALDKQSFANPWSERSYQFEVVENQAAHMVVLEAPTLGGVIGFAGAWVIETEVHISTFAVSPDQRGRGYGEAILAGLLARAMALGATYAVLEVRVSNVSALGLYGKYEFEVVHRRKNYYRDNNEDAFVMGIEALNDAYRARFDERLSLLRQRVSLLDRLADGKP